MGDPTFVAYIDESGDEGFKFGQGSSNWFVLSAVILRREEELAEVKLVDAVRSLINQNRQPEHRIPDKKPLHFRDLSHEQRKLLAQHIAAAKVKTISVMVYKPLLTSPEIFQQSFALYHHAVHLLIERVSWYCRTARRKSDKGDGSVLLTFSNRSTMDYDDLKAKIADLETQGAALDYHAAPRIIRSDQIDTYSAGRRMGLQLADAVASGYFFAVEKSPHGFTEDAYVRLFQPCVYRYRRTCWGYGVKLFPDEAEAMRRRKQILENL